MAGIYFDCDQFKVRDEVHKVMEKDFQGLNIIKKKYFGNKQTIEDLPKDISQPMETFVYERKADEQNKNDFKIMAEMVKDLANPKLSWFIVATRDTDYIAHAEEVHKAKKNFGILLIENKDKNKVEQLSPKLEEVCDVVMTIRNGNLSKKFRKGVDKSALLRSAEDSPEDKRYSHIESPNTNLIVGWFDYNCKSYKKIALELDELIEKAKKSSTPTLPLNYVPIHQDATNRMFSPRKLACHCMKPLAKVPRGPEWCPVFHLYLDGRIQKEVVGANLSDLRKAIQLVYKILV